MIPDNDNSSNTQNSSQEPIKVSNEGGTYFPPPQDTTRDNIVKKGLIGGELTSESE